MDRLLNLFRPDPKEVVRKTKRTIAREIRNTDREIMNLMREQKKAEKLVREAAARGDLPSARVLARELVRLRQSTAKLALNKANLMALSDAMTEQMAMLKVANTVKASSAVMAAINRLVKAPALQATAREMARELYRAGLVNEVVSDALDTEELEEATDEMAARVLAEVAGEAVAAMAAAPARRPPAAAPALAAAATEDEVLTAALEELKAS